MDLSKIRKDIDAVNGEMVELFVRRMDIVKRVAEYKIENNKKVFDKAREEQLIAESIEKVSPEYKDYTQKFVEALIALSSNMQHDIIAKTTGRDTIESQDLPTVAYLGLPGSFSEQAVLEFFGEEAEAVSVQTFREIIKKVDDGTYDMAMIPVENSSTGSVNQTVDFLLSHDVKIVGEHIVKIRHFLLGHKSSSIGSIKKVLSHPQPLEQCGEFLRRHNILEIPKQSTADAAKEVSKENDKSVAAIASRRAAKIYGLNILAEDIQSNNSNYTRFVVIAKDSVQEKNADKISIICSIEHRPGALFGLLDIFSKHGLNMLQLFSRPIANVPWQYRFHLDFSGNLMDKNVILALKEIDEYCTDVKMLGNYRSCKSDVL